MDIDSILQTYQRFGVHLGLERIRRLLANLGNPHEKVPTIHVAGTNGKGSVCAYLSSVLSCAGYRVGRYTSPHLVDWNERICLNEQPISTAKLQSLLAEVERAIAPDTETPTQFEVITAAAWLYFAQSQVDVAVVEVGLGGRLDATNVVDNPLVAVITSISREHWQQLGPTLADIAREKAGILKPGCWAVVGQLPSEAEAVVRARIEELDCAAVWVESARELRTAKPRTQRIVEYKGVEFVLPLAGEMQLSNSAVAIATIQVLQQNGWQIAPDAIALGMANTRWLGRVQWTSWHDCDLLVDGAHNPAAAQYLRQYVDGLAAKSVTWVMGMLATKDHADIFRALLRDDDLLHLVPVPDHSSADPQVLASLAKDICPNIFKCEVHKDLNSALEAAVAASEPLVVLCGSLYLVGHFFKSYSPL
ncbi:bifunctional folylpolyglutamate synthase/dihydrofolate synthase [Aliterella atlantica]|uniref:Dihydrofolate synthase/folylpolyglutamate synthase n=1 Tax=Aliterella atlantica CENA595 TaxID=1618023 RepID=A0A0D8ZSA9_9CYAN|nr:folylpolyglutamate synthase/dihydrofolate synthase family protein [Aliterella atlantica]KJH71212.1 folylpolyglutamate synthase [Aliterella atlantica CENA595]